jgi:N utilization substance protein B
MSRRSRVRQVVLQLLFQDDLNPHSEIDWRQFLAGRLRGDAKLIALGERWFLGVRQKRGEIDKQISAAAQNWKLQRMPPIDRNIMRLAAFEFLYADTPHQVAINEAIDIAKRFGSNQSPKFVNGILDRIYRNQLALKSKASVGDNLDSRTTLPSPALNAHPDRVVEPGVN